MSKLARMNHEISQGKMEQAQMYCLSLSPDGLLRAISRSQKEAFWHLYAFLNVFHQSGEFMSCRGEGIMTDTDLIAAIIAAKNEGGQTGKWETYEQLKAEFFRRLNHDQSLAETAIKAAQLAGLKTF